MTAADLIVAQLLGAGVRTLFGVPGVYVNTYGAGGGVKLPFGGYQKSGYGREKVPGVAGQLHADQKRVREIRMTKRMR